MFLHPDAENLVICATKADTRPVFHNLYGWGILVCRVVQSLDLMQKEASHLLGGEGNVVIPSSLETASVKVMRAASRVTDMCGQRPV